MEVSPRAPVLRSSAREATASMAASVSSSSTPSRLKRYWYWETRAFLGSVMTRTSSRTPRSWTVAMTGRRPMNSGMRPNL